MEPIGSVITVPAVSVVVPCYNGGRFLDGMMASLAQQTFRDFEIVIVDDGSTDALTARKLDELKGRAHVVRRANGGASAARNTGAREARADIIFMLDCDDTIEPTFLAETVPALQSAPPRIGMAVAHMRLIGAESGVVRCYFNRFDLLFTNTLSSSVVLRKSSWKAAGGYDETMREGYEDWDFSLRLAHAGFDAVEIAKPLYIYHVACDDQLSSISSSVHAKQLYAKLWRQIRDRNPRDYGLLAILQLWWSARHDRGRIRLWKGLAGYMLALVLPDATFNQLISKFNRRRLPPERCTA
jgi:glycosyltransferase involved in cell wall biosynthesis